jgi:type III secretory pathway component EscR
MTYEPLNRRLAILAAVFAFLGVILGVIALATNYWTISTVLSEVRNETGIVDIQSTVHLWNVCILKFQKMNLFF